MDDSKQLEFLAESNKWFGPGSRIIITTRDMHLLLHANAKYKPALLRMDEAVELFSWHTFREKNPPDGYRNISNRAIRYTGHLPLALKVLGSFLHGREASEWESALDKLAKIPNRKIFDTLKLSFDYLDDDEKKMFLDIACFFKGKKVEDVTRVLDCLGFHTEIGIRALIEKSLITVSNKTLGVKLQLSTRLLEDIFADKLDCLGFHTEIGIRALIEKSLITEMGWKIVSESFPGSRLWLIDVIHDLIKKSRELHAIEAISVPRIDPDQGLPVDVFENMKNLRLLDVYGKFTCGEPTSLPDELRWFCWSSYPFASLPVADMHKLVGLELGSSNIKYLWHGRKKTRSWEVGSQGGVSTRKISLERSEWVGVSLVGRNYLESGMYMFDWADLIYVAYHDEECGVPAHDDKKLDLSGSQISDKDFPEDLNGFFLLEELSLRLNNRLLELPASITHLTRLKKLNISECGELQIVHRLPSGIQVLDASYCRSLRKIENLSEGYEWLNKISLYDCKQLLQDAECERYLDKMLKETFLTKYSAVDSCVSIVVPGNMISSWFKEQQDGNKIALKLPPNWQTQIMGFAISAVFSPTSRYPIRPHIELRFEDDGMLVTKTDIDSINACSGSEKGIFLWVGYVPFSLFEQLNDDGEDWSHVFGGNLLINIYSLGKAIRCGAKVVYKEEVESTQQFKPSIPFYRNWRLSQTSPNVFLCDGI
ncbi:disease resistance protein (TIR-NBS-LRR class) family [Artemisia annua]|uniref:Disease resistance protein (TIR-NBS-LRR class) family n=1 Tax=Artemisia annua TaxID=35608 RepID=A0A2U1LYU3_ARTAN|nr:disease resistance protein (TIR-NBS-LRR class) family [Artemisia annua]